MKIIGFKAQNIKNIKAVEIQADGKTIVLSGKNESGKSSIIDAITMTLTGQMVERPIRNGEDRAEVEIDLGDYIVKRIWTGANNRLEVMSKDKAKYTAPQTLLNGIIGRLAFDPLAFKNMDKKPQRDLLAQLVGLDFTAHDAEYKKIFDERTVQNRLLTAAEGAVAANPVTSEPLPESEISLAEEMAKIQSLRDSRKAWEGDCERIRTGNANRARDRQKTIDEATATIEKAQECIADRESAIEKLQQEVSVFKANIGAMESKLKDLSSPSQVDPIPEEKVTEAQIAEAQAVFSTIEKTNEKIRQAKKAQSLKDQLDKQTEVVKGLTTAIEKMNAEKAEKINSAKFPVEGLAIADDCVLYNGLPFNQASEGVKIRVSTAIAMKLNPKLRTIFVKEGSLLDSEGKKTLISMARENDYQMFIEEVSDDQLKINIEE